MNMKIAGFLEYKPAQFVDKVPIYGALFIFLSDLVSINNEGILRF